MLSHTENGAPKLVSSHWPIGCGTAGGTAELLLRRLISSALRVERVARESGDGLVVVGLAVFHHVGRMVCEDMVRLRGDWRLEGILRRYRCTGVLKRVCIVFVRVFTCVGADRRGGGCSCGGCYRVTSYVSRR